MTCFLDKLIQECWSNITFHEIFFAQHFQVLKALFKGYFVFASYHNHKVSKYLHIVAEALRLRWRCQISTSACLVSGRDNIQTRVVLFIAQSRSCYSAQWVLPSSPPPHAVSVMGDVSCVLFPPQKKVVHVTSLPP